jgi:hypothetical protein
MSSKSLLISGAGIAGPTLAFRLNAAVSKSRSSSARRTCAPAVM